MSINSYIVRCIFLCLSSHACHARPLGAQLSSKKNEMGNVKTQLSLLEKLEVADKKDSMVEVADKKDSMVKENKDPEDNDRQMDSKIVAKEMMRRQRLTNRGAKNLQAEFVGSVAWLVPHKKRGHQQPGFNLDYAPPKTHPPVHN